jgi:hypothetical protein
MSADLLFADPRDAPPPQELNWGSTLAEFFGSSLWFSDELIDPAKPPRFIRMYADRWQINWQLSGIPDPEAQTVVDVFITVRPIAPATITVKV